MTANAILTLQKLVVFGYFLTDVSRALKEKMPSLTQLISLWKVSGLSAFPRKRIKNTLKPENFKVKLNGSK